MCFMAFRGALPFSDKTVIWLNVYRFDFLAPQPLPERRVVLGQRVELVPARPPIVHVTGHRQRDAVQPAHRQQVAAVTLPAGETMVGQALRRNRP